MSWQAVRQLKLNSHNRVHVKLTPMLFILYCYYVLHCVLSCVSKTLTVYREISNSFTDWNFTVVFWLRKKKTSTINGRCKLNTHVLKGHFDWQLTVLLLSIHLKPFLRPLIAITVCVSCVNGAFMRNSFAVLLWGKGSRFPPGSFHWVCFLWREFHLYSNQFCLIQYQVLYIFSLSVCYQGNIMNQ